MFFSAKELYDYLHQPHLSYLKRNFEASFGTASLANIRAYTKVIKQGIVDRSSTTTFRGRTDWSLSKWHRPWHVVPKLRDFSPPEGDYGIGVEVEMGFRDLRAASFIANKIKNWKYVALDIEGGTSPIEATFPPVLYSKMSSKSQVFRYLKVLRDNSALVFNHADTACVGTHINVSKGGAPRISASRCESVYNEIDNLPRALMLKYFGRSPYGGCYPRGKYIEYKLFNSTTNGKALRKYINIAVALTDLICSTSQIDEDSVLAAIETGYYK